MTGKWQERKQKGLCTKCGVNTATGKRKILCDICRSNIEKEHNQMSEAHTYYDRDHSNDRG